MAHVITDSLPFGGAQRNTLLTLAGLVRAGYPTALLCGPGGPLVERARELGVAVFVVDDLVREVAPTRDARALRDLYRHCRAHRFDIVHTHSVKAGFLGRVAARLAGVPGIVHTLHGVPFPLDRSPRARLYVALERGLAALTDGLVCVGEALRQEMLAHRIAPARKLTTIYSAIDFAAVRPRRTAHEMRRALGLGGVWPVVGSVGRLCEQKAQDQLVLAVARLRTRFPAIRLLLAGEGPLRPRLERSIRALGLAGHVALLGERDDVPDILTVLDVYAMSSRWEGVGRALTEAMSRGLPVVATGVNGVGELVRHEETGLLVHPDDPGGVAAAIARLATDRALARRLGAAGRATAERLMESADMLRRIEALYARLAERP